jgi:putative ABC transport system permease protein
VSLLAAASSRHLLRRPAQALLALAGLALGVATITAVDIATASAQRAFELSMAAANGRATQEIVGLSGGFDEALLVRLASQFPQLAFAPQVEGYATVGGRTLHLIGIDPLSAAGVGSGDATGAGPGAGGGLAQIARWLTVPGAVALSARTADELGLALDAPFALDVGGRKLRAVPIMRLPAEGAAGGNLLIADIAQAQEWLGLEGRLTRITVSAPGTAADSASLAALGRQLPPALHLESAGTSVRSTLDLTSAFAANLRAMSLLALLVGLFLIFNAISFAVLQRRRTLGILRALGATREQLLRTVLAEAVLLGTVGAGLGLALGVVLGRGLIRLVSRTINDLYFVVSVANVSVPPSTLLMALAAGVLTALAGAWVPALEAAHASPVQGIARSSLEARTRRLAHQLALVSLALALAAGVILALSSRSLLAGFIALFLLLLSVATLTPALLRIAALATARVAGLVSPVARLACADIAASLSRTGVAVAALGMAVAAMIGVTVMVGSFRQSLESWLVQALGADVYVTAPGPGFARPERRLEPALVRDLLTVPGVRHHSATRRVVAQSTRGPITIDALEAAPESAAQFEMVEGARGESWDAFEHGAILMAEPLAWSLQMHPGQSLELATQRGPRPFRIAGIYRDYGNDRGAVLMSRALYAREWSDESITSLGLYLQPGIDPAAVITRLYATAAGRQELLIGSNVELRDLSLRIFERTFVITRVLNWLAAGVAAVCLLSALCAWELERARELAVLRSLGLTRRATAALIALQTAFMGAMAFIAAVPAGLLASLVLVTVINRRAFGWQLQMHLTGGELGAAAVLALTAALAGAIYPAWRCARAPVIAGLRTE